MIKTQITPRKYILVYVVYEGKYLHSVKHSHFLCYHSLDIWMSQMYRNTIRYDNIFIMKTSYEGKQ